MRQDESLILGATNDVLRSESPLQGFSRVGRRDVSRKYNQRAVLAVSQSDSPSGRAPAWPPLHQATASISFASSAPTRWKIILELGGT
jgi:hypothetical protein